MFNKCIPLFCLSINYHKVSCCIRKKFNISIDDIPNYIKEIKNKCSFIKGIMVLSTCNRFEIYFTVNTLTNNLYADVEFFLSNYFSVDIHDLRTYVLWFYSDNAIEHLFKLSAGLDSLILGENEILGQIKRAYKTSVINKYSDNILNICIQHAVHCGKNIRNIGKLQGTAISYGTIVADDISKFCKKKSNPKILLVGGSGQLGRVVIPNILNRVEATIYATIYHHTLHIKDKRVIPILYKDRYKYISECSVIISMTCSPHYVFSYNDIANSLNNNYPDTKKLFIDVSLSNDIDPDIANFKNIELHNLDDFQKIIKKNQLDRNLWASSIDKFLEKSIDKVINELNLKSFLSNNANVKNIDLIYKFKKYMNFHDFANYLEGLSI
ncbi:MAG: hypothetical protein ACI4V7_01930 [Succinivibrionaceae bacterium]